MGVCTPYLMFVDVEVYSGCVYKVCVCTPYLMFVDVEVYSGCVYAIPDVC